MKFIGLLNKEKSKSLSILNEDDYKYFLNDQFFWLFSNSAVSINDFSHCTKNNIHVILVGDIKAGGIESKDTLSFLIEKYISDGMEFFNALDGSFIIILWDGRKKILYIRRDGYGTKLLYFYFSPRKGLIFSNNLDILRRAVDQKKISHKALHEYLRFLDISPPYTIHENIYFLEPEKILVANGTSITQKKISNATPFERQINGSFTQTKKDFKNILYKSIENKITYARRVGISLSGGIDSTLLCALAANVRKDIMAYTVGFSDPRYDELEIAQNVARYLGIEHQFFRFTIEEDYRTFNDFVSCTPSPFADPAAIPTFQYLRRISENVDVLIDGTGADSLIGIMPARHIRLILKYFRHIPSKIRLFLSSQLRNQKFISSYSDLFSFSNVIELLIRWQGWTEEEISSLCNVKCDLSYTRFYRLYKNNCNKIPYDLYSMLIGALPDDRIHQVSELLEVNVAFPFFDLSVQEFVKKLPLKYKYNKKNSKVLFRKILKDLIPLTIWNRPKHGFDYPFENLLMYGDYKLPKSFLSPATIKGQGIFNPDIVDNYLNNFLKGDEQLKFKIWALVVFQAWYFKHYGT